MQPSMLVFLGLVAVAAALPQFQQQPLQQAPIIPIVKKTEVRDDHGQFALSYLTGDGAAFTEQGALKPNTDPEFRGDYSLAKQGSYSYISPEGVPVKISWMADSTGFHPVGDVIPVAPAVPAPAAPAF